MYQHILVATELTEESHYVARKAAELAALFHAKLSFVHVIDPIPTYACGYVGVAEFMTQVQSEAEKELKALLTSLAIESADSYIEKGPVKLQISDLAQEIGADLIITGNHGRHGLALLLGNTSSAILHHTHSDVMVIRYADSEDE